jgi:hypothetical protein
MTPDIIIWEFQMSLARPRVTETASAQLNAIQISNIQYLDQT